MKTVVEINHVSKKYRYGESQPYFTLRDKLVDISKLPARIFQKAHKSENLEASEFWALKDVSFKVNQGDAVGIIGANGAGKSTLLKILSRITPPTSGEVLLRGRVGSLLEVGTGFHQELTGRENVFLNGAILGMKRSEIKRKFDEIVDFSGIEKFLDTPVKHYSSGMYARLAFAVAANLESEILIVDEVLAVGDLEFQKKCLGKMGEITSRQGRTILFVSHNMSAVKRLCNKGVLLEGGKKVFEGTIERVSDKYMEAFNISRGFSPIKIPDINVVVNKISINNNDNEKILPARPMQIDIEIESERDINGLGVQIMISSDDIDGLVFLTNSKSTKGMNIVLKKGMNHIKCLIKNLNLSSGKYKLGFGVDIPFTKSYYFNTDLLYFDVVETIFKNSLLTTSPVYGHVYLDNEWTVEK